MSFFLNLNAFDYLMIVVLIAFAVMGAIRGFVLEVFSLILWPLVAFISWVFAEQAAEVYVSLIKDPQLRLAAAFFSLFLILFIIGSIIVHFVHRALPLRGPLRTPNVVFGAIVGFLRGGIIIVIGFLVLGITSMPQRTWWHESQLTPHFQKMAVLASGYLPRDIARHIRFS